MVISALLPAALLITIPQAVEAYPKSTLPHYCRVYSRELRLGFNCNQIYSYSEADKILFIFVDDYGNILGIIGTAIRANKLNINAVGFLYEGEIATQTGNGECTQAANNMLCDLYVGGKHIRIEVSY